MPTDKSPTYGLNSLQVELRPLTVSAIEKPMETKPRSTRVKAPTRIIPDVDATSKPRSNDNLLLNPDNGRSKFDSKDGAGKKKLTSYKKGTNISTYNTRTIRLESKRLELAKNFTSNGVDVLGIVDHKIVHDEEDEEIKIQEFDCCTLITSSAWRNTAQAACGGVGIMVNKDAEGTLSDVTSHSKRILITHFNGNPVTTIIVHYAPVEGSEEAEDHYIDLANVINSIPKHNLLLVIGDYNAHLGPTDVHYTYHNETNSNGRMLLDLATECNMEITNTRFQKKAGKLWTYISDMSGTKSQVDYILVNRKWKNSIKNVEAYNSFASSGSDHRLLSARIKLSLRTAKAPSKGPSYDWKALRDPNLQEQYTISIQNRFGELCKENDTATEEYQHLIQANNETAQKLMPPRKKRTKRQLSEDTRVVEARQKVQNAFNDYQKEPDKDHQTKLQFEKQNLQEAYNVISEEELESLIQKVENADSTHRHAESWKLINEISGRKSAKKGVLKGNSKEERLKKWFTHFSDLLGKEPTISGDDQDEIIPVLPEQVINTGPFTPDEYQAVKKKLILGKSKDPDGFTTDVLKLCDIDEIVLQFCNKVLIDGSKPQQWSVMDLITIPKSGDLGETNNYRGISLSSIAAKITNKMLLNRIQPHIDPHLRPNQNGFRPGRSTTAHILALRRIIEGIKRNNLKAIILFVDFKKAFDSIHRGKMMKILRAYGIPQELVNAITLLYEDTKAKVQTPDGETDLFDILAGVLQGDTLAPYLFAIVIDYVMRQAIGDKAEELGFKLHQRRSSRIPAKVITDLMFADDIALLSEEIDQAQELIKRVEEEAEKVGLHVNAKKTELMAFGHQDPIILAQSGQRIKVVKNFKYLGGWMESTEKDINIRKALAWKACHKLTKIWKSTLKRSIKIRLFIATVEAVLLYGCDTWTLTKKLTKQLDGMYTRMLRMVLDISWKSHTTNIELYGNLPKLSQKIAERRLRLAGHCVRHTEEIASDIVLWVPSHGRTRVGRPAVNYIDLLQKDTGLNSTSEIRNAMMDRKTWREYVSLVRLENRPR